MVDREAQANREVGRTDITRGQKWTLTIAFLTLMVGVPLVQRIHEIRSARAGVRAEWTSWRDLFSAPASPEQPPTAIGAVMETNRRLMSGIKKYEDGLTEDSLLTEKLLPPVQEAMTRTLGAGNEKAYVGREGWLFYRPDIELVTGRGFLAPGHLQARAQGGSETQAAPMPDPVLGILKFKQQLAERGIALVVVPVPVKPVVQPEKMSGRYGRASEPIENPSHRQFLDE